MIGETAARCGFTLCLPAQPASPRCLMNAAVGPRKVIAQERFFHNTAIAVAALLSCAPLAWSQTPADKATTSTAAPAAAQPKKAAAPTAAPGGASDVQASTNAKAQP